MLTNKGKYASATENRRYVWGEIIWPLILEINDVAFSLEQYQMKRDIICKRDKVKISSTSRGLVSLIQKGILIKEEKSYAIHFRLIPYLRLKAKCDYASAIHEVKMR